MINRYDRNGIFKSILDCMFWVLRWAMFEAAVRKGSAAASLTQEARAAAVGQKGSSRLIAKKYKRKVFAPLCDVDETTRYDPCCRHNDEIKSIGVDKSDFEILEIERECIDDPVVPRVSENQATYPLDQPDSRQHANGPSDHQSAKTQGAWIVCPRHQTKHETEDQSHAE